MNSLLTNACVPTCTHTSGKCPAASKRDSCRPSCCITAWRTAEKVPTVRLQILHSTAPEHVCDNPMAMWYPPMWWQGTRVDGAAVSVAAPVRHVDKLGCHDAPEEAYGRARWSSCHKSPRSTYTSYKWARQQRDAGQQSREHEQRQWQ